MTRRPLRPLLSLAAVSLAVSLLSMGVPATADDTVPTADTPTAPADVEPAPVDTVPVDVEPAPLPEATPDPTPSASKKPAKQGKPANQGKTPAPTPDPTPSGAPTPEPTVPAAQSPLDAAKLQDLAEQSSTAQRAVERAESSYLITLAARDVARTENIRTQSALTAAGSAAQNAQHGIDTYARAVYMNGPTDLTVMNAVLNADSPTQFADMQTTAELVGTQQTRELQHLVQVLDEARAAATAGNTYLQVTEIAWEDAGNTLQKKQAVFAKAQAAFAGELAAQAAQYDTLAAVAAERNATVAAHWAGYVKSLATTGTPPLPASTTIARSSVVAAAMLPDGYRPVPGFKEGSSEPGVAEWGTRKDAVDVLPTETIKAVTTAVNALGSSYLWNPPKTSGLYDCATLVSSAWGAGVPGMPRDLSKVAASFPKVPVKRARPGDIVLIANTADGIHHAGVVVENGLMVAGSAASGSVTVQDIPTEDVWGVVRPSLGALTTPNEVPVPDREPGSEPTMRCDAPPINVNMAGQGAWGGWANGLIPLSAMCPLADNPGHYFRCDAAHAWEALDRAYRDQFNKPMCLTDSYRPYEVQANIYAIGRSHAVPGTSNHGWGLATDLCVYNGGQKTGIGFSSPDYIWLRENAPKYGWIHPMWAREGQPLAESWHWQYLIDDSSQPYTP